MIAGRTYRHSNVHATYDIYIHKIQYRDEKRIKIKYSFVSKQGQKFIDFTWEKATIQKEDLKYWSEVK